jgi:hypothetical protein
MPTFVGMTVEGDCGSFAVRVGVRACLGMSELGWAWDGSCSFVMAGLGFAPK